MNNNINRNCRYYDYGDTAPREYGAFCRKEKKIIESVNCDECEERHTDLVDVEFYNTSGEYCKIRDMDKEDAEILKKILEKYLVVIVKIIGS